MNRFEKEFPNTGGARMAVNRAINTGKLSTAWRRFEALNQAGHELRRALWGVDKKTAWGGDRDARIGRYVAACREFDLPRLP